MSNINTSDLVFPNGRPVTKVKMDAKKLKKAKNIRLNQAQNICSRTNGLDLDWDDAIVFLKKQAEAKRDEELASLGGLLVGAYKDAFQLLTHKNDDFDVINYQPSTTTVVHGSITGQQLVDALKRMDLANDTYSNWLKNTIRLVECNGLDSTFSESALKRFQDPVWLLRMAKKNEAMHTLFYALIPNYNGLLTTKSNEVISYLVAPISEAANNAKQHSISRITSQVSSTLAIESKYNADVHGETQLASDFGEIFETEPADIDFNDLIRSRSKDLLLVNTFLSKKTQSTDGTVEILMLKDEPIDEMDIENKHSLFIGTRRTTHLK
uniref:Uncharacterized protein n=1 Tax=Aliivibrio wodanis TaxID=80852 RepID=A0A5Q4ZYL6_9GAMM|nr:hypothetical protein [Aliivibrio wodanis]VVV06954.1 hypothetical protein AW0309160_04448 [Aliivibrio wodanis]